jgi:hypothetical protein
MYVKIVNLGTYVQIVEHTFKIKTIFTLNLQSAIMIHIMQNGIKSCLCFFFLNIPFGDTIGQQTFFSNEYANYRWKADSLYRLYQYKASEIYYEKAIKEKAAKRFKRICYYNSSLCLKYTGNLKKSTKYLKKSIKMGVRYPSILAFNSDTTFNSYKNLKEWKYIIKKMSKNINVYSQIDSNFRTLLLNCYKTDQFYRNPPKSFKDSLANFYDNRQIDSIVYSRLLSTDHTNQLLLQNIIKKRWIGLKSVGEDGDQAVWLIVQHADTNIEFQKKSLKLIEKAIINDNTRIKNYPYLVDRLLINNQEKQIFGTQFREVHTNGKATLNILPLRDQNMVDKYRNCFGLETVDEYLKYAKSRFKFE